ncbi:MAG: cytochrome c family protein [Bacteroidales bacterium]|nr:cytochrome c family protein [Bacteroidales bacterium]
MKKPTTLNYLLFVILPLLVIFLVSAELPGQKSYVPTTLNDFFFPGSQPLESGTFADPDVCDNCHGGYDLVAEPAFNWRGSMMAQAQRDPLYLACLTISNQDAPEVGDICIRCHTPVGWLEGRSVPTNGSALIPTDREGVQCHTCHRMIAPSPVGVNPYPNDPLYVTGPGNDPSTYTLDQNYLTNLPNIPPTNANGMYVNDDIDHRRGPYYDPQANHAVPYSPFHPDAAFCGTCHDVSNPVYQAVKDANGNYLGYTPNNFDEPAPDFSPYEMFPVERTYSEWLMSEYNTPGGVDSTYFGGNKPYVSTCQDCHMKDVTGKGCNKSYAPVRDDLPMHDMTGGNTFIPLVLETMWPDEVNTVALYAGIARAQDMLQHAASMELIVDQSNKTVDVKITNETGHKLPSGYPEGRRIWINLKAYNSVTSQFFESGYYDNNTAILETSGTKIYQIKPGLSPALAAAIGLTAGPSFHFVLSDTIYYDNRIPPRGFTNANFDSIQSPPVGYTYADGQYWDVTNYQLPFAPDSVEVTLIYQTTSKEYIEFLRDENVTNNTGQEMYDLWTQFGKSTPEPMVTATWSGPPVQFLALDLKANLEGPFNGTEMNTILNTSGYIPLSQPYNTTPWNYTGTEAVASIPGPDVVDWILVELRDTTSAALASGQTIIATKAALLLKDGSIVETDGQSILQFTNINVNYSLFVVLWHRNAIGIMSAFPLVETGGVYSYDFTDDATKVYGGSNAHKELAPGVWGMIAADGNADNQINNGDKIDVWSPQAGGGGYIAGDFNLDGEVNNGDKNDLWIPNTGLGGQVPE